MAVRSKELSDAKDAKRKKEQPLVDLVLQLRTKLRTFGIPFRVLLTKADKLRSSNDIVTIQNLLRLGEDFDYISCYGALHNCQVNDYNYIKCMYILHRWMGAIFASGFRRKGNAVPPVVVEGVNDKSAAQAAVKTSRSLYSGVGLMYGLLGVLIALLISWLFFSGGAVAIKEISKKAQ